MKRLLSSQIIMAFVSLFFAGQIFAQDITSYNEERPFPKYSRNLYLTKSEIANYPEVSAMALRALKNDFSAAKDVHWSIVEDKFMARFNNDGRINRILYDKKGHIVYSIYEGTVKNLPADIRKAVKSIYFDYDITMTAEVHTLDKTAWIINLEDETSLVTVTVVEGEVIETGNYRKSK